MQETTLTLQAIDDKIIAYETALADKAVLGKRADQLKAELVKLVEDAGSKPANAKSMKRLSGVKRSASLTYSTTTLVNEEGVGKLRAFLESKDLATLFGRFFELQTPPVYVPPPPTHRRLDSPDLVFENMPSQLGARIRAKVFELYGRAITQRPNQPSLKIEAAK